LVEKLDYGEKVKIPLLFSVDIELFDLTLPTLLGKSDIIICNSFKTSTAISRLSQVGELETAKSVPL
jgi:hypothetical protein